MGEPKYQVTVTHRAEASLEKIIDYLAENVSLATASKVRVALIEIIRGLADMPQRHGLVREISDDMITYRRVVKWHYRVIFTIDEPTLSVFVVEVDHAKRDPERLKKKFKK
jgi:plasmid stabilization system protein ParE